MLRNRAIEMIQRLQPRLLIEENIPPHPIRQRLRKLVLHMRPGGHGEDVIQLLERPLLRLGHPEENHHQRGQVQAGVKAERAEGVEGAEQAREGDGEHGGPEEARCHGPGHADLAVREREDFRRVGEGDRTLAGRVEGCEEEDEERDEAQVGVVFLWDDEAQARGE